MWPPHSVNTWPTPASLSTRATSSPPVSSAMSKISASREVSPEFLPLHGLPVEPLGHEQVADAVDHPLAATHVRDEPRDLGGDPLHHLGEAGRRVPPGARSARH